MEYHAIPVPHRTHTEQAVVTNSGPTLFEVYDAGPDDTRKLATTFSTLGAFALNSGSKDAALVVTLQAGKPYTVQVSGVNNTTGEALVELYLVP